MPLKITDDYTLRLSDAVQNMFQKIATRQTIFPRREAVRGVFSLYEGSFREHFPEDLHHFAVTPSEIDTVFSIYLQLIPVRVPVDEYMSQTVLIECKKRARQRTYSLLFHTLSILHSRDSVTPLMRRWMHLNQKALLVHLATVHNPSLMFIRNNDHHLPVRVFTENILFMIIQRQDQHGLWFRSCSNKREVLKDLLQEVWGTGTTTSSRKERKSFEE
jgi:hypothetical protein